MGGNFEISERKLEKIKGNTKKLKEWIEEKKENIKYSIEGLKNKKKFDEVIEDIENVTSKILHEIEGIEKKLELRIYIGIVGHYSHGKSSLINCLFSKPGIKENLLPTGENIVTSLPTRIDFVSEDEDRYFIGSEGEISYSKYKDIVVGKSNRNIGGNLIIEKAVKNDKTLEIFSKKNISIIDTPGLGGPYYNDTETTKKLMQQFSLIILVIKATDIEKKVADKVRPFLEEYSGQKIIVVTFWDKWKESPLYEYLTEEKAFEKCRELIKNKFEIDEITVNNNTIFVSSKNYIEGIEVPEGSKMSKDWNIDMFKSSLIGRANDSEDIITRKKSISPIEEKKIFSIKRELSVLKKNIENVKEEIKNIEKNISDSKKDYNYIEIINEIKEKLDEKIENSIERTSEEIEDKIERESDKNLDWEDVDKDAIVETNDKVDEIYKRSINKLEKKIKKMLKDYVEEKLRDYLEDELKVKNSEKVLKPLRKIKNIELDIDKIKGSELKKSMLPQSVPLLNKIFKKRSLREKYKNELKKWKKDHSDKSIEKRIKDAIDEFKKEEFDERIEKIKESLDRIVEKDNAAQDKIEEFLDDLKDRIDNLIKEEI